MTPFSLVLSFYPDCAPKYQIINMYCQYRNENSDNVSGLFTRLFPSTSVFGDDDVMRVINSLLVKGPISKKTR